MDNTADRRIFLTKLSLFSTLCLTGTTTSYANITNPKSTTGLIIKADNGEVRYIGNTRKAKVIIKISKTTKHTPEMSLLTEVITPGDGIPVHKHLNEEEFLFVQKGKIEVTLGDFTEAVEPGDLIYIPKGAWHGFQNQGKEDVVLFFGYSPSGFEDYFRAIGTTNTDQNLGYSAEDWKRTNKKFGIVYRS